MNFHDIRNLCKEHIVIAAHRGTAGGNIPCNTIAAYDIALSEGAEIIEIDVAVSNDGKLFTFHPDMEPAHLLSEQLICDLPSSEVEKLHFVNYDRVYTQYKVNTLDEVLEHLKGRCCINVDKFWTRPKEIADAIKRHGMEKDVIIKSPPDIHHFQAVEAYASNMPYMSLVYREDTSHQLLKSMDINYVGVEIIFQTEQDPAVQDTYLKKMKQDGYLLWGNAILYNIKEIISAGHTDDAALCGNPDYGWGWFAQKGFDIIQTDWTAKIKSYFSN